MRSPGVWADWEGREEETGQYDCWKTLDGDRGHSLELAGSC